ncbi:MAG: MurR/RpiR family transcriptional regulator [Ferrimicrobium sp.]|uniref:MurR/RpiR family transcriptional regulator n=1 Tax=Ferrimicrobium sp. TaxID=2926050 RepID=UPI002631EC9B|nr:MurR/RpiR family transcriptional regulator [Ferrimicrobium sp.]
MTQSTVAEVIRAQVDSLTKSERKIAKLLLEDYPVSGLAGIPAIAEAAGVSAPTIVRFVTKLGFKNIAEMREQLQNEISTRLASPLERLGPSEDHAPITLLGTSEAELLDAVTRSFVSVNPNELEQFLQYLCDLDREIVPIGGRISHVLAQHLSWSLQVLRPKVRVARSSPGERINLLLDVDDRSVVVAFDYRRYSPDTIRFVEVAKAEGATVLLVTDPYLSPAAKNADVVLTSAISSSGVFDALTPSFALVEALLSLIAKRLGGPATDRVAKYEKLTVRILENDRNIIGSYRGQG